MKNKIMACLLVLSMLFVGVAFTSCGETAAEVVEPAFKNTQALKSYKAKMVLAVKCDNETQPVDDTATTEFEYDGKKLYAKIGADGEDKPLEKYTNGDLVYTCGGKATPTIEKLGDKNKMTYAEDLEALFQAPDAADLEEIEVVENEDGTKSVSVVIPDEELNTKFGEAVSNISVFAASNLAISLYDGKMEVVVDANGYVSSYKVTCAADRTWMGNQLRHDVTIDIAFDAPGTDVTVTDISTRTDIKFIDLTKK